LRKWQFSHNDRQCLIGCQCNEAPTDELTSLRSNQTILSINQTYDECPLAWMGGHTNQVCLCVCLFCLFACLLVCLLACLLAALGLLLACLAVGLAALGGWPLFSLLFLNFFFEGEISGRKLITTFYSSILPEI
jgi:hypothetical protein